MLLFGTVFGSTGYIYNNNMYYQFVGVISVQRYLNYAFISYLNIYAHP